MIRNLGVQIIFFYIVRKLNFPLNKPSYSCAITIINLYKLPFAQPDYVLTKSNDFRGTGLALTQEKILYEEDISCTCHFRFLFSNIMLYDQNCWK